MDVVVEEVVDREVTKVVDQVNKGLVKESMILLAIVWCRIMDGFAWKAQYVHQVRPLTKCTVHKTARWSASPGGETAR